MTTRFALSVLAALAIATPAYAQRGEEQRHTATRLPTQPTRRAEGTDSPAVDNSPHVVNNLWYGHESPNDPRFVVAKPFAHGRLEQIGPSHIYAVTRMDAQAHRVYMHGGFAFEIAPWDWSFVTDWCWDCGGGFVVYADPDHLGWYLLYDIRSGMYVHATYWGT